MTIEERIFSPPKNTIKKAHVEKIKVDHEWTIMSNIQSFQRARKAAAVSQETKGDANDTQRFYACSLHYLGAKPDLFQPNSSIRMQTKT